MRPSDGRETAPYSPFRFRRNSLGRRLLDEIDGFLRRRQIRQPGRGVVLPDLDAQLAVAFDGNRVGHDGELRRGGADVAIAGDLQGLLGEIQYAVYLDCAAADDQIWTGWNGVRVLRECDALEQARRSGRGYDRRAGLGHEPRGVVAIEQNDDARALESPVGLHLERAVAEHIHAVRLQLHGSLLNCQSATIDARQEGGDGAGRA